MTSTRADAAGGRLHLPAGSTRRGPYEVDLTQAEAGWDHTSLRVLRLGPGDRHELITAEEEVVLLPLQGGFDVTVEGERFRLRGRAGVFDAVSDCLYVPRDTSVTVTSEAGGRLAVPGARAATRHPVRYQPATDVPVELRGAGSSTRQVNNFCAADSFEAADSLIAVEVITPAGNWSSYPPHKHDEDRPGHESALEEIYYFEVAPEAGAPADAGPGLAYHRVYGTAERPVDVLAEVRDGDVVLVPHGWHGPSIAAPGYHLYYLNVMAGPAGRRWEVCDDPAHGWVRGTWSSQRPDPRLPLTRPAPPATTRSTDHEEGTDA